MSGATSLQKTHYQGHLNPNGHEWKISQLPDNDLPRKNPEEGYGTPPPRERPMAPDITGAILMGPPRIGPLHEQVVPWEEKPRGDSKSECTMHSPNNSTSNGGCKQIPLILKWEFPRLAYLKANPEQLLKGDTLKPLCIAAELDIIYNVEKTLMREKTYKG